MICLYQCLFIQFIINYQRPIDYIVFSALVRYVFGPFLPILECITSATMDELVGTVACLRLFQNPCFLCWEILILKCHSAVNPFIKVIKYVLLHKFSYCRNSVSSWRRLMMILHRWSEFLRGLRVICVKTTQNLCLVISWLELIAMCSLFYSTLELLER